MVRNKSPVRLLSLLLCMAVLMSVCVVSTVANAVTGSQVAEDGTYYTNAFYGYKKGELKYRATLGVEVKNGIINSLEISNATDSKMYKALTPQLISAYTNIEASISSVNAVEEDSSSVDIISSSTVSSSYSSSSKYSVNLKEAIIAALSTAQPRSGSSATGTVYSGSVTVDSYSLKVNVSVSDGKISEIEVDDSSTGSWSTVLSTARSNYVGKTISDAESDIVDAVSSATKYSAAFYTAVKSALSAAPAASSGSSGSSTNGSGSSSSGTTTYTGNGSTQNITIKVGEIIKLVSSYSTSSYRQWTTSEWSGDTQLYTNDYDEVGNTITVTGKSVGTQTYQYYGYWSSTNNESFVITVEENSSGGGSGSGGSSGSSGGSGDSGGSDSSGLHLEKRASALDANENFSLTLEAYAESKTITTTSGGSAEPVDVVLLLDTSASMDSLFNDLQTQANNFIKGLSANSKVAVVEYGQSQSDGWTDASITSWTNASSLALSLSHRYGNNYCYGTGHGYAYEQAYNLLNDSTIKSDGRKKYVVNISDGVFDYSSSPYYGTTNSTNIKNAGTEIFYISVGTKADTSKVQSLISTPYSTHWYSGVNSGTALATALSGISTTIVTETTSSSTNLGAGALLKDYVTDEFDLSNATVTAKTYAISDTNNSSVKSIISSNNINLDKNTGVIAVTGFDYSSYYSGGSDPRKIVVTISGIKPKSTLDRSEEKTYPTNKDTSGIYEDSTTVNPVDTFPIPTVTIPAKSNLTRQRIVVKKEWKDTAEAEKKPVTVAVKNGDTVVTTLTLNSGNNWQATYETTDGGTFTVKETGIEGGNLSDYIVTGEDILSGTQLNEKDETVEVTASNQIVNGEYYVFIAVQGNNKYYLFANNQYLGAHAYTETADTYLPDEYYWQVVVDSNGKYHLKNKSTGTYMSGSGGNGKTSTRPLLSDITDSYTWVDITSSFGAVKVYNGGKYRHLFANDENQTILNEGASGSFTIKQAKATPTVDIYTYTITNTPKKNTHTLKYDANGGSGAPDTQSESTTASSYSFTISTTQPTRTGYKFLGWAEVENATTATYQPSSTITVSGTKTLYAVWEKQKTITVTKKWADGFDSAGYKVTVAAVNGNVTLDSVELNSSNSWTGTLTVAENATYEIKETKVTDSSNKDVTEKFTSEVTQDTVSETWSAVADSKSPVGGTTYVVGFKSGSDVYLLSADGTSAVSVKATTDGEKLKDVDAASQWTFVDTGAISNYAKVFNLTNVSNNQKLARDSSGLLLSGIASNVRINATLGYFQVYSSAYRSFWCTSSGISSGNSGTVAVTLYTKDAAGSSGESWTITNTAKEDDAPLTGVTSEKTTAYVITGMALLAAGAYFAAVRRKRRKTV